MCVDIFRWMDISKYENKEAFDFLTHQCIANCIFLRGAWGVSHMTGQIIYLYTVDLAQTFYITVKPI